MNKKASFLECDSSSIFDKNLKFVKNELEDEFQQMFGEPDKRIEPEAKIVTPIPGICIKAYKVNSNEKFFINLCQTDGIPPPREISENDLTEILQSETPSSFRIPMSISQTRTTKDNSNNPVEVCDVAINPKFLKKCEKTLLFRDFLISLILEALDDKYNIQLKTDNWLILKNRKFIGSLVSHRVRNADVKSVTDSFEGKNKKLIEEINPNELKLKPTTILPSGGVSKLIEEIDAKEAIKLINAAKDINEEKSRKIKESISLAKSKIPKHQVLGIIKNGVVAELLAEFWLPECLSVNEIHLDIGEDRIFLESMKRGYLFDKFTDYKINQDKVNAIFDSKDKILRVKMELI